MLEKALEMLLNGNKQANRNQSINHQKIFDDLYLQFMVQKQKDKKKSESTTDVMMALPK